MMELTKLCESRTDFWIFDTFSTPSFSLLTNCCIFFVTQLLLAILHEKCISLRCFLHKSGSVKFLKRRKKKKSDRILGPPPNHFSGRGGPESFIYISICTFIFAHVFLCASFLLFLLNFYHSKKIHHQSAL